MMQGPVPDRSVDAPEATGVPDPDGVRSVRGTDPAGCRLHRILRGVRISERMGGPCTQSCFFEWAWPVHRLCPTSHPAKIERFL